MKSLFIFVTATALLFAQDKPVTHIVMCWMDSAVSSQELDSIIEETKSLDKIPGIQSINAGKPIASDRPIVDDSFSFGITMKFQNESAMNTYLADPRHTAFVAERIKPRLKKLLVYDIQE